MTGHAGPATPGYHGFRTAFGLALGEGVELVCSDCQMDRQLKRVLPYCADSQSFDLILQEMHPLLGHVAELN